MKNKRNSDLISIHLLATLLLILSCSPKTDNLGAEKVIHMDDKYTAYNASDLFTITNITKLENSTGSIISEISKIEFKNDTIYVLDKISNKVFIYNSEGGLLSNINHRGHGNGEYISIDDFVINAEGNILILDKTTKSILSYDNKGVFIGRTELPFYSDAFELYNNNVFVFNCSDDKMIKFWDIDKDKEISAFLNFDVKYSGRVIMPFVKCYDKLYYKRNNDNNLYCVNKDSLSLYMQFDFEQNTLKDKDLKKGFAGAYYPPANQFITCRFYVSDSFTTLMYQSEELDYPFYAYLSNTRDEQFVVTYSYLDKAHYHDNLLFNRLPPAPIGTTKNSEAVSVIQVDRWMNNLEAYNDSHLNEDDYKLWRYRIEYASKMEKDDTILVLYKPKFDN